MPVTIPIQTARRLAIQCQFPFQDNAASDKTQTLTIINNLSYIQIDTISVIERTHHHTLWTRVPNYQHSFLHDLQAKDRAIFEYWGHAMSYLPMQDFRYFLNRMEKFKNPTNRWVKDFLNKSSHYLYPVKKRIEEEGPLASKDFKPAADENKGPWWDWKPAKAALELLFWRGELMITERKNFQKIYDLTERVLPEGLNLKKPSESELAEFLIQNALKAMGIATELEIRKFLQPDSARDSDFQALDRKLLCQRIKEMEEEKLIEKIQIDTIENHPYYILSQTMKQLDPTKTTPHQLHILTPFDNLIIQRERLKKLFNFDYTLECYVPAAKRKFGYFTCPILYKDKLVGRLDPKADRKEKCFMIQALQLEPDFEPDEIFLSQLTEKLNQMKVFNQCDTIKLKTILPVKYKQDIKKYLN